MTAIDLASKFFEKHPEIDYLDVLLPDVNGLLRGKRIVREQALKPWKSGVALSASVFCFDVLGEPVEESGLSFDIGDRDYMCRPIDSTLSLAQSGFAQVMIEMLDDNGGVYKYSPRLVLESMLDRMAQIDIYPTVAVELEFYLLKKTSKPSPIDNPTTGEMDTNPNTYLVDGLEDYDEFISDVCAQAKLQGLPAETAIVESSPGQFEINLHYRKNVVQACDESVLLKRLIKQVATSHGYQASFMAKPFHEHAGNGKHIHIGLYNAEGQNLLCTESHLHKAIAGLQTSMQDMMLFFAPHANSYRRMVEGAYVPLASTWGENNRTVALRLPLADDKNKRIEHRVSGADANPYLVVAAICAGILHGFENELVPTEAIMGNAYEQVLPNLPRHWTDAQSIFAKSEIVREYFGDDFHQLFTKVKAEELKQYSRLIPDLDFTWYMRTV